MLTNDNIVDKLEEAVESGEIAVRTFGKGTGSSETKRKRKSQI